MRVCFMRRSVVVVVILGRDGSMRVVCRTKNTRKKPQAKNNENNERSWIEKTNAEQVLKLLERCFGVGKSPEKKWFAAKAPLRWSEIWSSKKNFPFSEDRWLRVRGLIKHVSLELQLAPRL
jgi:hypothetical protein